MIPFAHMPRRQGMKPCSICHGGTSEISCPDCDGLGYGLDVEGNYEDCDRCFGQGDLPPDECDECLDGFTVDDF
jgi:DnaJ-class molecular chaperone